MNSQAPESPEIHPTCSPDREPFCQRILVAEDDPMYCLALRRVLGGTGYGVQCVNNGYDALEMAQEPGSPRLILLDWMMPRLSGTEVCRRLRERNARTYPYIILLSGNDKKSDIVEGLEAGADDDLTKSFDTHELLARVRVGFRIVSLQNSLLGAQEQLRFQATHDPLTGVWNRGALLEFAGNVWERTERQRSSLAFLLVDIDHFKKVNDDFGHQAGDVVLKEVARRLSEGVRTYDIIGRYGGEEFLVVAEVDASQTAPYAERLRLAVVASPIVTEQHSALVSVSIGAACSDADHRCAIEELIHRADVAMYSAKHNGRNRCEVLLPGVSC